MPEGKEILVNISRSVHWESLCTINIVETLGINRFREPVTFGIPFPQGKVFDVSQLGILNDKKKPLPTQVQALARWSDGSLKWGLLDFFVDVKAGNQVPYVLGISASADPLTHLNEILIHENSNEYIIDTGVTKFTLSKGELKPFAQVEIDGQDALGGLGSRIILTDKDGHEFFPEVEDIKVGCTGPIRCTFLIQGTFANHLDRTLEFFAQLSFFSESGFVEFKLTVHNSNAAKHPGGLWDLGDNGSFRFKDFSVHVPFLVENTSWSTHPKGSWESQHGSGLEIYQDSSGGVNWNSSNHCNQFGDVVPTFCGYRLTNNHQEASYGKRALPTVSLQAGQVLLDSAIEKFWQNFPKSIEVQQNELILRLFPSQCQDLFELQGGEQKTHSVYFKFSTPDQKEEPLAWVHERLVPCLPAEWYAHSGVVKYLAPRTSKDQQEYMHLIDSAIEGQNTFFDRREVIDEYGWRNFGDLYADHEAVGHDGETSKVSHYNNQYDPLFGFLLEYMRTGNSAWFSLAVDLARHIIDIDIYHTQEDRPRYNGGYFWHTDHYVDAGTCTHRTYSKANITPENQGNYGGGPSNEHNYTSGLLYYYYMTGDVLSGNVVQGLADWVVAMDKGFGGIIGCLDRRPSGWATTTVSAEYHGPGRGAGNSINALLDSFHLTEDFSYLRKAEEMIRRCIHPHDDIQERHLEDVEYRWSYLIFLQVVGKYLDKKIDIQELDYMYAYARASLLAYAEWMLAHEVPYKQVLARVQIPTETWSAQDMRKSNVFKFASMYADTSLKVRFLEEAEKYYCSSIFDLLSFETSHLTRPIILMLVNGYMHSYFRINKSESAPALSEHYDFGMPIRFKGQLHEAHTMRKVVGKVIGKWQRVFAR